MRIPYNSRIMNQYMPALMPKTKDDTAVDMDRFCRSLREQGGMPFSRNDTSVGMEYELQVAVVGNHKDVDLPISIGASTFFKNLFRNNFV